MTSEEVSEIMKCLVMRIPPLPQFITVGHAVWSPGFQHNKRNFQVYDVLFVVGGKHYMTEEDEIYELSEGGVLVLEPGKTHWGHQPVDVDTDIYWVHFVHPAPIEIVQPDQIPWSTLLRQGTDKDLEPTEQFMYLPKYAHLNLDSIIPTLDEMVILQRSFSMKNALQLHALTSHLLYQLQAVLQTGLNTRAFSLSEKVIHYLNQHLLMPFSADHMQHTLHFHFDYLSRCLKQFTGLSPLQYRHHLQMEKAKILLIQSNLTVGEVGEQVGISSINYFARLFRQHEGISPGQYRANRQKLM